MVSFHDVMKTYRWEVRFLSFMFGIAEGNALSCYKRWSNNSEGFFYTELRSKLVFLSPLQVKDIEQFWSFISETSFNFEVSSNNSFVKLAIL